MYVKMSFGPTEGMEMTELTRECDHSSITKDQNNLSVFQDKKRKKRDFF